VKTINIAIDGPSGAGKSTIAKEAAKLFGFAYVDTGALYRSIGYYFIMHEIEPNEDTIHVNINDIHIKVTYENFVQKVFLNDEDVSEKIRTPHASMMASKVSAFPAVREKLLSIQREIAMNNNVIMDGRDIGTTILPHADLKIYITASVTDRAKRRFDELQMHGEDVSLFEVEEDIQKRDYDDSHRAVSPLRKAKDAILIDTSGNTLEQSISAVVGLIRRHTKCGGTI
jgi:cytidylate kinase